MCTLRDNPGKPAIVIHSKEGTLQGDVFGAANYAIAMLPLAEKMCAAIPRTLQRWFADNSASGGSAKDNTACLEYLCVYGVRYGHFPSPKKSWYIFKDVYEPRTQEAFNLPKEPPPPFDYQLCQILAPSTSLMLSAGSMEMVYPGIHQSRRISLA